MFGHGTPVCEPVHIQPLRGWILPGPAHRRFPPVTPGHSHLSPSGTLALKGLADRRRNRVGDVKGCTKSATVHLYLLHHLQIQSGGHIIRQTNH